MKRFVSLLLALCLLCTASMALAAGNVTIALQGRDGFDGYISSMFVWGDRLLLSSYDGMYTWSQKGGLVKTSGYENLDSQLVGTEDEPGVIEVEEGEYAYLDSQIFVVGDQLYRIANISGEDGIVASLFVEMQIAEDGTVTLGEVIDMGDVMTIDYGDGYIGSRGFSQPCTVDRVIYALSYGESNQEMVAIDLDAATMDVLYLDTDKEIRSMAPFTEGKLLLVAYDYNTDPITVSLMAYDIESQELTELGVMPNDSWSGPTGICYDEARGKIYYVQSGSVWRMDVSEEGLGEPEEFGDMPLEIYSDATPVLMGDLYIVSSYEGVVGRDVTLDKLPEQRLRVSNASYSEPIRQAYYSFTDAHPEYMVSISSGSDTTNLVQDMMNRSAETDIYTISSTDKVYQSLIERGFMAELGGSEKLTAYVDPMYDIIKNYVTRDGQLYAVPLGSYASVMTLNKKLLTEKFGYDEADLPTTWPEMFELLSDLASGKMEDVPEATLLGPGYILRDVKATIFNMMLQDYFLWLDQSEENLRRGSEVLIACCEAFEQIDWAGFGLPEEYEENEEGWMYDPETVLMSTSSLSMYRYSYEEQQEPWPLAVAEGEDRLVGMSVTMAFVNPYSEHRDAAIEYLECALDSVQPVDRMCMDPTINEPVENSYYQESLADIDKSIADIEKSLEETEDEEQREMLTQQLEEMQQWREEYERDYRYDVSEEGIAGYRAHDSQFMIQKSSVWSSGAYEQVDQYIGGTMSAQQLASELEKTLQMQRLEGI